MQIAVVWKDGTRGSKQPLPLYIYLPANQVDPRRPWPEEIICRYLSVYLLLAIAQEGLWADTGVETAKPQFFSRLGCGSPKSWLIKPRDCRLPCALGLHDRQDRQVRGQDGWDGVALLFFLLLLFVQEMSDRSRVFRRSSPLRPPLLSSPLPSSLHFCHDRRRDALSREPLPPLSRLEEVQTSHHL